MTGDLVNYPFEIELFYDVLIDSSLQKSFSVINDNPTDTFQNWGQFELCPLPAGHKLCTGPIRGAFTRKNRYTHSENFQLQYRVFLVHEKACAIRF